MQQWKGTFWEVDQKTAPLRIWDPSSKYTKKNIVGSMEALWKAFLLFFLLPDWLKLNNLKSRMECGFSHIFSLDICSTVAETNYAASFGAKKCSENHIWSFWDDARFVEPTKQYNKLEFRFIYCLPDLVVESCYFIILISQLRWSATVTLKIHC